MLRADGAGRRIGRRSDAIDGAARGRRLRAERAEELDLVRHGRRPRARVREDRSRSGAQGDHGIPAREGHARIHLARQRRTSSGSGPDRPGELFFENVEVPVENRIGEEGQGFEIAMYSLDHGRFTVAAGACGVMRACLERSVEYARERETFGSEIGRYQFVQDMIATMVLGYETSKLLVMQAAWMKDRGSARRARRRSRSGMRPSRRSRRRISRSRSSARTATAPRSGSSGISATRVRRSSTRARRRSTSCCRPSTRSDTARLNGRGGEVSPHLLVGPGARAGSRAA